MNLSEKVNREIEYFGSSLNKEKFEYFLDCIQDTSDLQNVSSMEELNKNTPLLLLVNATKLELTNEELSDFLQHRKWSHDRIECFLKYFNTHNSFLRTQLIHVSKQLPQLVDVKWKSDYILQDSTGTRTGIIRYLITLVFYKAGCHKETTFSCSVAQLSLLVYKLNQALRCIKDYGENSK